MAAIPSIACIGIIGKYDNPLHIHLFPPHTTASGAYIEFSFLLNGSLDMFEERARDSTRVDQDKGLLQTVDERHSIYGWETGTGVRFAIVIDYYGREGLEEGGIGVNIRDGDLKPAFRALQTAYITLLQNPFYTPDDHPPMEVAMGHGKSGEITSRKFIQEVERIGMAWKPGVKEV